MREASQQLCTITTDAQRARVACFHPNEKTRLLFGWLKLLLFRFSLHYNSRSDKLLQYFILWLFKFNDCTLYHLSTVLANTFQIYSIAFPYILKSKKCDEHSLYESRLDTHYTELVLHCKLGQQEIRGILLLDFVDKK